MRNLLSLCAGLLMTTMAFAAQGPVLAVDPRYVNVAQENPGVAEELDLTSAEQSTLFDILDRHKTAQRDLTDRIAGARDPAVQVDLIQQQVPLQRQRDEAIATLLGPARYTRWQDFERTRSQRRLAASFASTLARAGLPLRQEQQQAVLKALVDEEDRYRQKMRETLPAGAINLAEVRAADFSSRLRDLAQNSLEDSKRRTLDAVAPLLDARQMEILRQQSAGPARLPDAFR
jgi:hypothetical protein